MDECSTLMLSRWERRSQSIDPDAQRKKEHPNFSGHVHRLSSTSTRASMHHLHFSSPSRRLSYHSWSSEQPDS